MNKQSWQQIQREITYFCRERNRHKSNWIIIYMLILESATQKISASAFNCSSKMSSSTWILQREHGRIIRIIDDSNSHCDRVWHRGLTPLPRDLYLFLSVCVLAQKSEIRARTGCHQSPSPPSYRQTATAQFVGYHFPSFPQTRWFGS